MPKEVEQPTINEYGDEQHPAWGVIGAHRVSSGPPGKSLFDSDLRHQHFITVTLNRATRNRDLNRDWIHGKLQEEIVEVSMSEAQWASFVSSMNSGSGTPCTIERVQREDMPETPHQPRLAESMDEVYGAADKALEQIREAFAKVEEKPNKGNVRNLKAAIENAPSNMKFAATSLSEHAENVVQKAKADVEAMVLAKAEQIGLDPGEVTDTKLLGSGE